MTEVIEKPTPTIQYIDRYKTDTVRFVKWRIRYDTVTNEHTKDRIVLDTLFFVDTLRIVEAWLTELNKYDTTATFKDGSNVRLRWQNYQNLSENMIVDYSPVKARNNWALGVHSNIGMQSDFKSAYRPMFGLGLQATVKRSYFGADYGYNGQHYVGVRIGYNFVSR